MALLRFTGRSMLWPPFTPGVTVAPSLTAVQLTLDAGTEVAAFVGPVCWADRGTHDIRSVSYLAGTITDGSGTTRRTSLQDASATAGPPLQPDGSVDQSFTSTTMPTSDAWTTDTLTADRTNVAHGTLLSVVFDYSVFGSGTILNYQGFVAISDASLQSGAVLFTGTWAARPVNANIILTAADGTIGWIEGGMPCASTTVTEALNTGTTPDEIALDFTPAHALEVDEVWAMVNPTSNSRNYEIILYEGVTAQRTAVVDANTTQSIGSRINRRPIAPFTLTAGTTYRVAVKPTTANSISVSVITLADAAHRAAYGGTAMGYTSRSDAADPWDARTTTKVPLCGVGISGIDVGGGTIGGGARGVERGTV